MQVSTKEEKSNFLTLQRAKKGLSVIRASLENFGRAILVPISVIPLLALIGAIGYAMQSIYTQAGVYVGDAKIAADAIKNIGMIAITNIDFLIAVGLAAGLAKSEKVSAALSGLMAYAAIHFAANLMLQVVYPDMLKNASQYGLATRFGVMSFQYSAFGGMVAGLIGYFVHKKTYKMKFPTWLSFFGGPRFSPVASVLVAWVIGMPLGILWIYISKGLNAIGDSWSKMGAGAPFLYGFAERALIPFGLHQVLNYFLYYTSVGASWTDPTGKTIEGIYNVAQARLGVDGEFITAHDTWIVGGTFVTKMFSLPAAALAMYFVIPKDRRKVTGSAITAAGLTSFLAGTTEPIEFTFLFSAPLLYGLHTILTGMSQMIMYLCSFAAVSTRGSGVITWFVVNPLNANKIQNIWGLWIIGPAMGTVYFSTWYFLIKKFNFKTPGRENKIATLASKDDIQKFKKEGLKAVKDYNTEKADLALIKNSKKKESEYDTDFLDNIIQGCGGEDNIDVLANCVTRLRVTLYDKTQFNENLINLTNPFGIKWVSDKQVQIIYGPRVTNIATLVRERLGVEE